MTRGSLGSEVSEADSDTTDETATDEG
jgi:hypothetical protein